MSRIRRQLFGSFLSVLIGYPIYLLLVGPYSALNGSGRLDLLPEAVRDAPYYPAAPVYFVPVLRTAFDDYLHWWYLDPNEADRPTGWL
jgi:hypothetical protein